MAIKQNFSMFSGNDVTLDVELIDEATESPLILFGVQSLVWSLARRGVSMTPLVEKTLDDGVAITDAANGRITVDVSAEDTDPLDGMYYHELRMINSAGKKITLMYGAVEITINLVRE